MSSDDYYIDDKTGLLVFTVKYHRDRGYCCGKKCRHCPYLPQHEGGSTTLDPQLDEIKSYPSDK